MFPFTAFNPHKHRIFWKYFLNLKKENVSKLISFISKNFREGDYLILDNHPSHLSSNVKDLFKKNKRLKSEWLPINALELNDVNKMFSLIQKEVLNNRNFTFIKEAKLAIDK